MDEYGAPDQTRIKKGITEEVQEGRGDLGGTHRCCLNGQGWSWESQSPELNLLRDEKGYKAASRGVSVAEGRQGRVRASH